MPMTIKRTVNGLEWPITVTEHGRFYAEVNGENFSEDTLDKLVATIDKETKAVPKKVAIPLHMKGRYGNGEALTTVLITGLHAGNGNVLYKPVLAGGKLGTTQQVNSYTARNSFFDLTDKDVATHAALNTACKQADEALASFERDHLVSDIEDVIKKAIAQQ